MSLELDEVFDVMGDLMKQVAADFRDTDTPGKISKSEALELIQSAIVKMISEATD